uniref:Uncharacterized protein n=1 Tax=Porphyridium purpureum TaxID=35688 RepID=A0A343KNY2_PORPP|nr:hypothetical protein [Porphyridium purpureum]
MIYSGRKASNFANKLIIFYNKLRVYINIDIYNKDLFKLRIIINYNSQCLIK